MVEKIIKKILSLIPTLLLISIILFALINVLPGDATMAAAGDNSDPVYIEKLREEMHLNDPAVQRYFNWISGVVKGDFGSSLITRVPVATTIAQRLPVTLEITILAMIISILIAVPLGIISAVRRNGIIDSVCSFISMLGVAMPAFWLGILLIMLFSIKLNWLPASGFVPFSENPLQNLKSIILPALSIGFSFAATVMRQTRSAMLEVFSQDYIVTARAKGLREHIVIWKHALRNALIPVVTVITMQIGRLIGGAAVTETIFAVPGIGRAIVDAITSRDYPLVMGLILVVAVFVVLTNAIVDIIYVFIDPRIAKKS